MRSRTAAETGCLEPFSARDAVAIETSARRATSASEAATAIPPRRTRCGAGHRDRTSPWQTFATTCRPGARRSHQAAVGGPAGQLVAARELQLAEHRGHVGLYRLHREVQPAGDLLVGVAPGDVPEDLLLPRGELVQLGVDGAAEPAPEGVEHEAGEAGREDGV